jgi:hypothetical protein
LKHNGKILYEHYPPTDEGEKKVEELLSLGNLYFLGENIGSGHPTTGVQNLDYDFFANNKQCCFWGRDYGHLDEEATTTDTVACAVGEYYAEYFYVFDAAHGWGWFKEYYGLKSIKALTPSDWEK